MTTLEMIKNNIMILYRTHPDVHVNVTLPTSKKVTLFNQPVVIKGVYPHVFQIEERSHGFSMRHTHQYTEVLTGNIEILELKEDLGRL